MNSDKGRLKKSSISDFFNKIELKVQEEQRPSTDQNKRDNVQSLRCPKRKVLALDDKINDSFAAKKHKAVVRKRSNIRPMMNLEKSQMVLDCGQRMIGSTTCKECKMLYSVDSAEDLKAHQKFHDAWEFRYEFPKNFLPYFINFHSREHGAYKVYLLGSFAEDAFKKLVNGHMENINEEIGYCDEKNDLWSMDKRIFMVLMVKEKRALIGGVLVIEKINKAWTNITRKEITTTEDVNDWIVGVDRIWVNPICRKQGVAYSLLDAATTQDRDMEFRARRLRIAFSEPTADGVHLLKRFTRTRFLETDQFEGEVLVY